MVYTYIRPTLFYRIFADHTGIIFLVHDIPSHSLFYTRMQCIDNDLSLVKVLNVLSATPSWPEHRGSRLICIILIKLLSIKGMSDIVHSKLLLLAIGTLCYLQFTSGKLTLYRGTNFRTKYSYSYFCSELRTPRVLNNCGRAKHVQTSRC